MEKLKLENLPHSVELHREGGEVSFRFIDERLLPEELIIKETRDWREVVEAVKALAVRGAPAIGLAGASALALYAHDSRGADSLESAATEIAEARPTAVNLRWAVERAMNHVRTQSQQDKADALYELVKAMEREDEQRNRAIGLQGARLLKNGSRVLTHCNAGSLATFYYGTALGIVYAAAEQGKIERVFADETRPVNQGSRLTVWELARVGVPTTLLCDNMAASIMAKGMVDAVIVGADRIAVNGDTANKIGTYSLAVLAKAHGIPFYVAAPTSTIDVSILQGSDIPIEHRDPQEVIDIALEGVEVYNPAFDVTPAKLITKIVTEQGVFSPEELARKL